VSSCTDGRDGQAACLQLRRLVLHWIAAFALSPVRRAVCTNKTCNVYVSRNIEVRSCNHSCSGEAIIITYSHSLMAQRSGDRIPVRARFSAPVQTGPGAHPASYTMGSGSFRGKAVRAWCLPPTPIWRRG
jgi:hypothetical protein